MSTLKRIAIILLLVIVAASLTGCASTGAGQQSSGWQTVGRVAVAVLNAKVEQTGAGRAYRAYQQGGGTGQSQVYKTNAYGPGIHMDQYGAPVRTVPAFR